MAAGLAAYAREAPGEVPTPEEVTKFLFDVQRIAFAALASFHPLGEKGEEMLADHTMQSGRLRFPGPIGASGGQRSRGGTRVSLVRAGLSVGLHIIGERPFPCQRQPGLIPVS